MRSPCSQYLGSISVQVSTGNGLRNCNDHKLCDDPSIITLNFSVATGYCPTGDIATSILCNGVALLVQNEGTMTKFQQLHVQIVLLVELLGSEPIKPPLDPPGALFLCPSSMKRSVRAQYSRT
jgi:hypothetical protein